MRKLVRSVPGIGGGGAASPLSRQNNPIPPTRADGCHVLETGPSITSRSGGATERNHRKVLAILDEANVELNAITMRDTTPIVTRPVGSWLDTSTARFSTVVDAASTFPDRLRFEIGRCRPFADHPSNRCCSQMKAGPGRDLGHSPASHCRNQALELSYEIPDEVGIAG